MNRDVLTKATQIVGVLFAAFGGFLGGIAPPGEADARFAVGLSSFLALIILLTIAALAKRIRRRTWIIVGIVAGVVAIAAAAWYWSDFNEYTFAFPPESDVRNEIAGTEMTPEAVEAKREGLSNGQILDDFGGRENKDKVWPPESVQEARFRLIASYVLLVLSIATAIFGLTEGALASGKPAAPPAGKPARPPDDSRKTKKSRPQAGKKGGNDSSPKRPRQPLPPKALPARSPKKKGSTSRARG